MYVNSLKYVFFMKFINWERKGNFKYLVNKKTLTRIYKRLTLPILVYGCELWDGCNASDEIRLVHIQRKAVLTACGLLLYFKKAAAKNVYYFIRAYMIWSLNIFKYYLRTPTIRELFLREPERLLYPLGVFFSLRLLLHLLQSTHQFSLFNNVIT